MEQGKVTALDISAGVGVINPDDKAEELPFLTSSVPEARSLKPEQRVKYEVVWGATGPEATDVQPLKRGKDDGSEGAHQVAQPR